MPRNDPSTDFRAMSYPDMTPDRGCSRIQTGRFVEGVFLLKDRGGLL
jgi:hypothetical protein